MSLALLSVFAAWNEAAAASSKSGKAETVHVRSSNHHLFEYKGGDVVCYADPHRSKKTPGKIVKLQTRSRGREITRKFFYSYKKLAEEALRRLSRKSRLGRSELKTRSKQLRDNLKAQQRLCNMRPFVWADLRLRWFPSDKATGYFVYVINAKEQIVRQEEAVPTGCTHRLVEGFTSGLCLYEIHTTGLPNGFTVKISAFNAVGESAASAPDEST